MKYPCGKVINCKQGEPDWYWARTGKVTGSRIAHVLEKVKSGESAKRLGYKWEILAERMTGDMADHYINDQMKWGISTEPYARSFYEVETGNEVREVGFVLHPTIEDSGASPDGLVGSDGLIEIKCPQTTTHLRYRSAGVVPAEYQPQMLWQMACTGREWCDFISCDPRIKRDDLQLFVVRFHRDDKRIAEIEAEVRKFLAEVDELEIDLVSRKSKLLRQLEGSIAAVTNKAENTATANQ